MGEIFTAPSLWAQAEYVFKKKLGGQNFCPKKVSLTLKWSVKGDKNALRVTRCPLGSWALPNLEFTHAADNFLVGHISTVKFNFCWLLWPLRLSKEAFFVIYQKVPAARVHSRFGSTRDPRGQPLRHMEQLLLVTSCDSPAGIGASLRTHGRTTHTGWTDRRDVANSILDYHYFNQQNTF